jgi:hypothetical protein
MDGRIEGIKKNGRSKDGRMDGRIEGRNGRKRRTEDNEGRKERG